MNDKPGIGLRIRKEIAGENYYFVGTRDPDGKIIFSCSVPDENKQVGRMRRLTADATCEVLSEIANKI